MSESPDQEQAQWQWGRALFVRGLGLVYLCAFVSLGVQLPGLVGEQGVLPARRLMEELHSLPGATAFWPAPTLAWFGASDGALLALWIGGALAGALALAGLLPALALAVAWAFYLSLVTVGQTFLGFQWDALLLEAGALGIFFAPWTLRLGSATPTRASRVMRLLCWWLVFRLFFFSGFVKLGSGDPTWWDLTALEYHWWTQPLPAFTAWFVAKPPAVVSRFATAATLAIELCLPFLVWLGPLPRRVAFAGLVLLQILIAATGSYGFFNLLTLVLCTTLLEDRDWSRLLRRSPPPAIRDAPWPQRVAIVLVATFVLAASIPLALAQAGLVRSLPAPIENVVKAAMRFDVVNTYGLFARMTTTRPEIIIEGSRDGVRWEPYEFRWKPGAVERLPRFTGPHMPRLDWQMWFAALGPPERSPWLFSLLRQLLLGSKPVLALLERNPFGSTPPVAVRALLYQYRFSSWREHAATGAWWTRERVGEFVPEIRLETRGGTIRP